MTKLWTFGDSFTEGFNDSQHWCKEYVNWKGYAPKVYGEILSEKFDMQLMNFGKSSWDNYSIFESFCGVVNQIKKNDLVIFEWSDSIRFRLTDSNGIWQYFVPSWIPELVSAEYMDKDSVVKILANRSNPKYSEEVNMWIQLINHTLKNISVIHWTPFINNIQANHLSGFETIQDETIGVITDTHFSEKGQTQLSDILEAKYNKIKRKEII